MPTLSRLHGWLRRRQAPRPARGDDLAAPFLAIYELAQVGAVWLTPAGTFARANHAFQEFIGYTEEELRALSLDDVTHPLDLPETHKMFLRVSRGELSHYDLEKRYVRKDGRVVWAHVVAAALRHEGSHLGMISLAIDVTSRKDAEDALQRSERKYRTLYTRSPVMLHSIDVTGKLVSVSDRWLSVMGYKRDEVIGRPSIEFLTPESREYAVSTVLPAFFKTGSCNDIQYQFLTKDGRTLDVELSAIGERDEAGRIVRSLAVIIDVTARRRAEAALAALTSELEHRVAQRTAELEFKTALLEAQMETSLDGILIVDPAGAKIISRNRRLAQMWRVPQDILESGSDAPLLRWATSQVRDPDAFLARVRYLYQHQDETSYEEVALRDGRLFERYSSPILGPSGKNYGRIWYFRDITDRRHAEDELRRKTEQLAQSNADLETYAYAVSHDLKAPLGKIRICLGLLWRSFGEELDRRQRGIFALIEKSAARMNTLIEDVLTLSCVSRESSPVQRVDLNAVMSQVLSDLEIPIKHAEAAFEIGPLPAVLAHESLIRSLLQNLVSNAVKFRREGVPPEVRVSSAKSEGGLVLVVSDNGIGFDPAYAKRIFQPFARLHPVSAYEGSGIGLAVCHRIVSRYGGRISAASVPDQGSTFTVWLPAGALAA